MASAPVFASSNPHKTHDDVVKENLESRVVGALGGLGAWMDAELANPREAGQIVDLYQAPFMVAYAGPSENGPHGPHRDPERV